MYFIILGPTQKCLANREGDVSLIAEAKMGFVADDIWHRV
jgi:hypothetical protein